MSKRSPRETDQPQVMLRHPLFDCLDVDQKARLLSFIRIESFAAGEILLAEGQPSSCFWVILAGKVSISRRDAKSESPVLLTTVGNGALVGESAAILSRPAIAGVTAESEVSAASLDVASLREAEGYEDLWADLLEGTARELATKLEEAGDRSVAYYRWQLAQLDEKRAAGRFTLQTLVSLGLYALLSSAVMSLEQSLATRLMGMSVLILICALATGLFMKDSRLTPADFGLSLTGWRERALEASIWSVPLILFVLALKAFLQALPGLESLEPLRALAVLPRVQSLALMAGLVVLSVAQEFIVRCGIQASLQVFYSEDRFAFPWKAILVSNLLFAGAYAHLGPLWALLIFVPGLFWGWLFARQQSLVGVGVSHALVTLITLQVLFETLR